MLHNALLFQGKRERVECWGEGVSPTPTPRVMRIGLWCPPGFAEKGQGVQERLERRIVHISSSAQKPQARVGVCWQSRLQQERQGAELLGGALELGSELRAYS